MACGALRGHRAGCPPPSGRRASAEPALCRSLRPVQPRRRAWPGRIGAPTRRSTMSTIGSRSGSSSTSRARSVDRAEATMCRIVEPPRLPAPGRVVNVGAARRRPPARELAWREVGCRRARTRPQGAGPTTRGRAATPDRRRRARALRSAQQPRDQRCARPAPGGGHRCGRSGARLLPAMRGGDPCVVCRPPPS